MLKLIAETAWHHEGDFPFMKDLVTKICKESDADIVKMHVTLDLDEYMSKDHDAYETLNSWMLSEMQWEELIGIVQSNNKELMLLLNDIASIKFAKRFNPEIIELHSVCLNVPRLQDAVLETFDHKTKVVIGVGGCTLQEVDLAVQAFAGRDTILMFGFQNYPTKYADVNLNKIRKIQGLYSDKTFGYADHTGWDEPNNELITLTVGASNMAYIEKHVTTVYGQERCDYSAAISIEMFNELSKKVKVINEVYGDGLLSLNSGEKAYSVYGPMKMAAVATNDFERGHIISVEDYSFRRTKKTTKLSQIDVENIIGNPLTKPIFRNDVFEGFHFGEKV